MAKEIKARGICQKCGKSCYIECAECFAVLLDTHQQHNCPVNCEEIIELCDNCEMEEVEIENEQSGNDKFK